MTTNFGEWTWCHCWVPLHGAMVMCYGGGRGSGAIAGCHCSVLWFGGDDQLWGSGRWTLLGAIAGCHCSVPWWGEAFFLYIENAKNRFCYLGSMLV